MLLKIKLNLALMGVKAKKKKKKKLIELKSYFLAENLCKCVDNYKIITSIKHQYI
jgi:hypothetical protein